MRATGLAKESACHCRQGLLKGSVPSVACDEVCSKVTMDGPDLHLII